MQVQPYLFFEGRCEEALSFYRDRLGAQDVKIMRHRENPDPPQQSMSPSGSDDKVMHGSFRLGDTIVLASDGLSSGAPEFKGVSLTLSVGDESEAKRCYEALLDGGETIMPLQKTFFSTAFGMVRDRFGVSWMVLTM